MTDENYLCIKCGHDELSQSEAICYAWAVTEKTPYGLCCCECVFPDGKTALERVKEWLS